MKKALFIFATTILLTSCSEKTVGTVTEVKDVKEAALPTIELTQGKSIYQNKCNQCHELKVIDSFTSESWKKILPEMSKRAKLEASDEAILDNYITWELSN